MQTRNETQREQTKWMARVQIENLMKDLATSMEANRAQLSSTLMKSRSRQPTSRFRSRALWIPGAGPIARRRRPGAWPRRSQGAAIGGGDGKWERRRGARARRAEERGVGARVRRQARAKVRATRATPFGSCSPNSGSSAPGNIGDSGARTRPKWPKLSLTIGPEMGPDNKVEWASGRPMRDNAPSRVHWIGATTGAPAPSFLPDTKVKPTNERSGAKAHATAS